MPKGHKDEIDAIHELRRAYPTASQRGLATDIKGRDFSDVNHRELASKLISRPFASIYSTIRRYDAKIKNLTTNAVDRASTAAVA